MEQTKDVVLASSNESFNPLSLMPTTGNGKLEMAKVLAASGLLPQGLNTPEKVFVALEWGHELQLSPMVAINNIAVVNGKPTLSADIMNAVVKNNKEYGGIRWTQLNNKVAECVVTRKTATYTEETRGFYSIEMAQAAGLTGKDNWKKYPERMLKHRALSYALRDAFPDVLAGVYNPEEMESVPQTTQIEPELRNVTPPQKQSKEETPPPQGNAPKASQPKAKGAAQNQNAVPQALQPAQQQTPDPLVEEMKRLHGMKLPNGQPIFVTAESWAPWQEMAKQVPLAQVVANCKTFVHNAVAAACGQPQQPVPAVKIEPACGFDIF